MSQPVITVAVSDALARIEAKVDGIANQMVGKADQAFVHELDARLRVVETTQATVTALQEASVKARGRLWIAVGVISGCVGAATTVFSLILAHLR